MVRHPGKNISNINVLMAPTIMPERGPIIRKAVTMGISQSWKYRNGYSGKGIFGPYMFRAAARAVKIMISERARVFMFGSSFVVQD